MEMQIRSLTKILCVWTTAKSLVTTGKIKDGKHSDATSASMWWCLIPIRVPVHHCCGAWCVASLFRCWQPHYAVMHATAWHLRPAPPCSPPERVVYVTSSVLCCTQRVMCECMPRLCVHFKISCDLLRSRPHDVLKYTHSRRTSLRVYQMCVFAINNGLLTRTLNDYMIFMHTYIGCVLHN